MTTQRTYRESALSARQEARQKLAEFRAARVQKREKPQAASPVTPSASSLETGINPQDFFAEPASDAAEETAVTEALTDVIVTTEDDTPAESAVEPDVGPETTGEDDNPRPGAKVDALPAEPGTPVDPNSDLFDLPAAQPGMIWMFHQCGIVSLADLASADATEVSSKLGVVGHILNVEPWIAFARERHPAEA